MNKPVTIDQQAAELDAVRARAQPHVDSGRFETVEAVLRAGLDALDDEDRAMATPEFTAWLRAKVAEADADPRPYVSMEEAFARVRAAAAQRR
ncbi:type II toxin-antitoxin system ParD family antitoxin [Sphingomonas sp. S1-29]|uniref:type II toxin-antitoxin system ParD family antitoxin n=1 Tax=Sphingomonas sp. S1-29 TaxID=2991074 RepID=UPI00223F8A63|nr:type II toxin-antitoxin system ParD family antitoxin [Sphingomonas sp. S1-29]UZK68654.1 type II toxin-antitoxin system ParD family antitoxin [Sphingomonas sp. S1-29]